MCPILALGLRLELVFWGKHSRLSPYCPGAILGHIHIRGKHSRLSPYGPVAILGRIHTNMQVAKLGGHVLFLVVD